MTATWQTDVSIDDYHKSPMLSKSKLGDFATKGPRWFAARHVTRTSTERRDASHFTIGNILEDAVQGRAFDRSAYWVKPEGHKFNSDARKAERDALLAAGKQIVTADELADIEMMRESIVSNETAIELIRACEQQVTLRMPWGATPGVQSRPDWASRDGCAVSGFEPFSLDLKSAQDLDAMLRGSAVLDMKYHAQGALVRKAMRSALSENVTRHYLLVAEKSAPYRTVVVTMPKPWLDAGMHWCEVQRAKLEPYYLRNEWPRTEAELVELPALPQWAAYGVDFDRDGEAV